MNTKGEMTDTTADGVAKGVTKYMEQEPHGMTPAGFTKDQSEAERKAGFPVCTTFSLQEVIDDLDYARGFFSEHDTRENARVARSLIIASEILTRYPADLNAELLAIGQKLLAIFDHPERSVTALDADELRAAIAKAQEVNQ